MTTEPFIYYGHWCEHHQEMENPEQFAADRICAQREGSFPVYRDTDSEEEPMPMDWAPCEISGHELDADGLCIHCNELHILKNDSDSTISAGGSARAMRTQPQPLAPFMNTDSRLGTTMGNALEVWVYVTGEIDGTFVNGWRQTYAGEDLDDAIAAAKKAKMDGYAMVKIEWRGDNRDNDSQTERSEN